MGELNLFRQETFDTTECCKCGVRFALPSHMMNKLRSSRDQFYCPNGHSLAFVGETEAQKLQKRLEFERGRREAAERDRDTARKAEAIVRGKLKAQSERVKNGVCPCCKRTVKQLAAHMKTKHPEWIGADV